MPKFIDYHDKLELPDEVIGALAKEKREGGRDEFDCKLLELFYNADGKVYCHLDAPSEDAVRKRHEALGVPCGDVHRVNTLES
jgi:hypothetical protein